MKKPVQKTNRRKASFARQIEVLFEDEAVIALDKPAGLPAVPVAKNSNAPSAWSVLKEELKTRTRDHSASWHPPAADNRRFAERAFVVHRIDRFTSGILLFAKTERDRDLLVQQFLKHTPMREYMAVVRGHLPHQEGTLVHYFRKEGHLQRLSGPKDKRAARAELSYRVERELRGASLVRVKLLTGLQNQIRVQFAAIGHPVIGDRKYHPAEAEEKKIDRVALHAAKLQFVHPRSGKMILVESDPPKDFSHLLASLKAG